MPRSRPSPLVRRADLGQQLIDYTLHRSPRRRTIGLRVDDAGLRVTAPTWTSETEIETVLHGHARWILSKLRQWRERPGLEALPGFADGDLLWWLGRQVPVLRVPAAQALPQPCNPDGEIAGIPIALECEDPQAAVTAWYTAQAVPWFRRRAQVFAERLGRSPREIRISSARGRWGSCTVKGVIRLNWRLMQASPAEIDYVIAHELAHLVEMNHSPAFWRLVETICPEWSPASDLLDARDREYRRL